MPLSILPESLKISQQLDSSDEPYGENGHAPLHRLDAEYWNRFYSSTGPTSPTPFAQYAADLWLCQPTDVLELGCGNGRDAIWFASRGHEVVGIDLSETAVAACQRRDTSAQFHVGDFSDLNLKRRFSTIYSRFTLHSIDDTVEGQTFENVRRHLNPGGRFLIEARSTIYDELCGLGQRVSDREWIYENHYRRFLDPLLLLSNVRKAGFTPEFILMSSGLAVWKEQNPIVIRLALRLG